MELIRVFSQLDKLSKWKQLYDVFCDPTMSLWCHQEFKEVVVYWLDGFKPGFLIGLAVVFKAFLGFFERLLEFKAP